ncbi:MAG: hypothetical protein HYV04_19660 [Deltaproteobacteria bacterium]|nr:hypothetical protein [Deltaproteobacteria bacterium]
MAFEKTSLIWRRPTYFFIWLITAVVVGWVYIGPLTNEEAYDAMGWVFAVAFPLLVGGIVAVQVANYRERKGCPVNATAGGAGGSILGVVTVGCATCPAILLGWIGLGAAVPSAFLASPWLKLTSLLLLVVGLFWASKAR